MLIKWRWTARCFAICAPRTVHLTRFGANFSVSLLHITYCPPADLNTFPPTEAPHGPQSSMPVPQWQANKSVESDNLSKALTQFKDKGSRGPHCTADHTAAGCPVKNAELNVNLFG